jgi:hypothetical protein
MAHQIHVSYITRFPILLVASVKSITSILRTIALFAIVSDVTPLHNEDARVSFWRDIVLMGQNEEIHTHSVMVKYNICSYNISHWRSL